MASAEPCYEKLVIAHCEKEVSKVVVKFIFSNKSNGGGEIENLNMEMSNGTFKAFIYFKEKETRDRLIEKKYLTIMDHKFSLQPFKKRPDPKDSKDPK